MFRVLMVQLLLLFISPAIAGPWEDANKAYAAGNFKLALRLFKSLAEQGHAGAQLNLGIIYAEGGEGVPQDYAQAVSWFRKAAEQLRRGRSE